MKLTREDEHFLEAIKAAPNDDTPRLVYSDLLQDRDSSWGELIAVQCALARRASLGESRTTDEHAALLKREHALLSSRDTWWNEALGYPNVVSFERGFPSDVSFASALDLTTARSWLAHFPELTRVRLDLREGEMLRLSTVDHFPSRGLMLRPQREPAPGYMFDFLDAGLLTKWLARVAQLDALEVWGDIEGRALAKVLASPVVSALRRLAVGATSTNGFGGEACLCHPDELDLDALEGGPPDLYASLDRLRHLSVSRTGFTLWNLRALVSRSSVGIRSIRAESVTLGDDDPDITNAEPLASVPSLASSLEVLDLTSASVHRARVLAWASAFSRLTTLHAGASAIDDDGAQTMLSRATRLRRIGFAKNPVGPRTVEAIADHVTSDAPIEALRLWSTKVGDRGAEILASSSVFSTLESLELSTTGLTARGARALASSKHLSPALRLEVTRAEVAAGAEDDGSAILDALRDRFAIVIAV